MVVVELLSWGTFKDVQFYPIMNFGPFLGLPLALDFHNVKNHGGGAQKESQEELPGTKNKRKQRKQHTEENQDNQK